VGSIRHWDMRGNHSLKDWDFHAPRLQWASNEITDAVSAAALLATTDTPGLKVSSLRPFSHPRKRGPPGGQGFGGGIGVVRDF